MTKIKSFSVNIGGFEAVVVKATRAAEAINLAKIMFPVECNRAIGMRKAIKAAAFVA